MNRRKTLALVGVTMVLTGAVSAREPSAWKPAAGPLMTRWAKDVSPDQVHPEYPRPQLVREQWTNLNGLWNYAIRPKDAGPPDDWDGKILVPFAVESALSGVMKRVGPDQRLWYRRRILRPDIPDGRRLLLHFGAVDWHATISVNGFQVGEHRGGYDAFTVDITEAIGTTKSTHDEIVVSVWDPTDGGYQPRGKQVRDPRGIWYTSVTGIWQTVWLESVPQTYIKSLQITPDLDSKSFRVSAATKGPRDDTSLVITLSGGGDPTTVSGKPGEQAWSLAPSELRLWSPESPFLYDLNVQLKRAGRVVDEVKSYCGMRKVEVSQDEQGINRLFLNDKPLFQFGPLDQGWWPDGLYTAPTDDALRYDIEITKKLGMNMARKHVKVESARWYYWCDKLGLMVWQDMPNGDKHIGRKQPDLQRSPESTENYWREYKALIDTHYNHPCIVAWVPFNEGWGQFETNKVLAWTKQRDPSRLVDGPSGWTDRRTGDMHDIHSYPGPAMPAIEDNRAVVLGEFGGLGWPVADHLWWDKRNWGYRTYKTRSELQQNYDMLMKKLRPMISQGLAAAIYTQTTDVEGEVNGLMTYDRAIIKLDAEKVAQTHAKFYRPPPIIHVTTLVPTSEKSGQKWRITTSRPAADWAGVDFDDSSWKQGTGGFGEKTTPGSIVRTPWKSNDLWARRAFELKSTDLQSAHLRIHHDEDAEVYINGQLAAKLTGYLIGYTEVEISSGARDALRVGTNTLAVHCHQTAGGQYIDVGLVDISETER